MKNKAIYSGYQYPKEIISRIDCLYYQFTLSYRDIEGLMAYRSIDVSYESIRQWCHKLGKFTPKNTSEREINERL